MLSQITQVTTRVLFPFYVVHHFISTSLCIYNCNTGRLFGKRSEQRDASPFQQHSNQGKGQ